MSCGIIASIETEIESTLNIFSMTEEKLADRFTALELTSSDVQVMRDLSKELTAYHDEINISFSGYMLSIYQNALLNDSDDRKQLLELLISNFHYLTTGEYTPPYIRTRFAIGIAHRRLGLPFDQLISDYSKYQTLLTPVIWRFCNDDLDTLVNYMEALSKIIYFDIGITLTAYYPPDLSGLHQLAMEPIVQIAQRPTVPYIDHQSDLSDPCASAQNLVTQAGAHQLQLLSKAQAFRLNERQAIADDIPNAIDTNQFCLYYQPVANLDSGEIIGMEVLIRWLHPERGLMQPVQFIDIAEEFSSISALGDWVIRRTCMDLACWRSQGITMPRIAINVSSKQLLKPTFLQQLLVTLNEFDVKPNNITLEITESMLLHYSSGMEKLLRDLKEQNFCLSMDDFGTGYSALQYLKHFPFDYVKIDQSFVCNILENSNDAAIANAVIAMSHSMGIQVIAEGVESEHQCLYLSQNMCDHMQGYYFSPPVPCQQAGEFITNKYALPDHLRRMTKISRTLLLVDDEPNILSALKRLFRQDGYQILTADSGAQGLELLAHNHVDVIISDQRMPNMTGVEFLRRAKVKYHDTVRIVLSGYTELQSITDAINEGSIYKFLTKPWDDEQLRAHISDAFVQKEMCDENRRLSMKIQTANLELAAANRKLADILQSKEKQLYREEISLDIAREALQHIPIPMIGIDDDGMVALVNSASEGLFLNNISLLGSPIDEILPSFNRLSAAALEGNNFKLNLPDFKYLANWRSMGANSKSRGKIITFFAEQ